MLGFYDLRSISMASVLMYAFFCNKKTVNKTLFDFVNFTVQRTLVCDQVCVLVVKQICLPLKQLKACVICLCSSS